MLFNYKQFLESNNIEEKEPELKEKFLLSNGKLYGSLEYNNFKVVNKYNKIHKIRFIFQANTKKKYYLDIIKNGNEYFLFTDKLSNRNVWFNNEGEAKMFIDFINTDEKITKKLEDELDYIKFTSFLNI